MPDVAQTLNRFATPRRVAVIGAGYAGMAAAVTLAERAVPVVVFESGPWTGGRARRVAVHGESFDNGQHILVGAYTTLIALMRKTGVPADAVLRMPLELRYTDGFALRSLHFPPPFDLLFGFLAARGAGVREKWRALRFMHAARKMRFHLDADITVEELLSRHGQEGRIADYLWRPLCISALNTPPAHASANIFLAVLRDTLAGESGAADLLLPRTDLSGLFPEPAARYIAARGGEVRTSTPVRSLTKDLAVNGESFAHVILAVGPHQLAPFAPLVDPIPEWSYQPIVTCYLQYPDHARLPLPMIGFSGGLVQWAFDRGRLLGEHGRIACVISAEGHHRELAHDELAARCARELSTAYPDLGKMKSARVITEKRATISCTPDLARPGTATLHAGLFLAGDYTQSEYPPTLEAAVRSGVRAATQVLAARFPD